MSGLLTKSKKMPKKKSKLSDPQIGRFLPRGSKGPACVPSLQRTSGRSCLRYPSDPPSLWAPRTAGRKPWKQPKITTFAKSRHHKIYKIINHHLSSSIIIYHHDHHHQSIKQASKQANKQQKNNQSVSQSINQSIKQTNNHHRHHDVVARKPMENDTSDTATRRTIGLVPVPESTLTGIFWAALHCLSQLVS